MAAKAILHPLKCVNIVVIQCHVATVFFTFLDEIMILQMLIAIKTSLRTRDACDPSFIPQLCFKHNVDFGTTS